MTDTAQSVEDGNFYIEPRHFPRELEPGFEHPDYLPEPTVRERMLNVPVMERLDDTMRSKLSDLFGVL